ncbi:FUSC family protein, partial [Escherichia sp. HC-TM1]
MHHGYWILLTSLFVCQPNYNATRHRLKLRII